MRLWRAELSLLAGQLDVGLAALQPCVVYKRRVQGPVQASEGWGEMMVLRVLPPLIQPMPICCLLSNFQIIAYHLLPL